MLKNEAFSRVLIDAQFAAQGWDTQDQNAVRYEVSCDDGTRADYVLCDRHGRAMAVVEAKRFSVNPGDAAEQAKNYARQLNIPYIFLTNGNEVRFWEWQSAAYPHPVKTFFKQDDLERRFATRQVKRDLLSVETDTRIAGRDYQLTCIQILCEEILQGRRKLLVEMATGTGKTRTAAAFIKRLFEANAITRVLFLVDRIPLAKQTEDAFTEHLPDYPCYVLRAGRRFQDEKLITITTLQSMVNIYGDYSPGYFDLVISDECHRSHGTTLLHCPTHTHKPVKLKCSAGSNLLTKPKGIYEQHRETNQPRQNIAQSNQDRAAAGTPAQAGMDTREVRQRPGLSRREADAARAQSAYRVRGSILSEHRRVLRQGHRDFHDPRRPMHAALSVLRCSARQTAGAGCERTG
jgi:hypothetical protein